MISESQNNSFSPQLLQGQVALVTGAGKGIGRACATALVNAGAKVIAVARTQGDLDTLHNELGDSVTPWVMDVTSEEFYQALAQCKELSILVNNVGLNRPQPFIEIERETFSQIVQANFESVFRASQIAVKTMLQANTQGSIVNISSQMGHVGSPNRTLYCATKHAVEGLSKALAVEVAEQGIRVNTVAPTFVETQLTKPMLENKEFNDFVMSMIPQRQLASVDQVAAAVVYLASKLSTSVTGTSLRIDGGWTAQ